jgi:hypothetical protein
VSVGLPKDVTDPSFVNSDIGHDRPRSPL